VRPRLLLTCEHGGNRIPPRYGSHFRRAQRSLAGHAGFDPGALDLAENEEPVLHVAVHSFAPELNGVVRHADVGLLYDPARRGESAFCHRWADALRQEVPTLRVRANYPYRGTADGLTTFLRGRFGAGRYWGVELEVNQKHFIGTSSRPLLQRAIEKSLAQALAS
jgi:predicted N-formylglutamate amidohydrolase